MKKLFYFLLSTIMLLFSGCGNSEKNTTDEMQSKKGQVVLSKQQFENSGMLLGTVKTQSFPEVVKVNGLIDVPPENRVIINATLGGYIKETSWLVGDLVKKGQVLVVIENPEFVKMQQEYLEAKEQLNYLKSEYERQRTLFEEKISSQKNFLKTESEFKMTTAKFNGLKKQLEMLNISPKMVEQGKLSATANIYSPINGSITDLRISKGSYVSPASPIMEIIDNSHIHLELSVFEKDIMKIKKEQPIQFRIPEASEEIFEAEVHLIGTSIGDNRSIKVHGHLNNGSKKNFLTGMFVEANIITDKKDFSALPSEAVVSVDDAFYALRLMEETEDSYILEQVEVLPQGNYSGYTGILSADVFEPSDKFLVKGAFYLITE